MTARCDDNAVTLHQGEASHLVGILSNIIEEDATGGLRLRFVFGNPLGGGPGGPAGINTVYRQALESTLATVRRLVQEGKLS